MLATPTFLDKNRVYNIAHRGGLELWPENTLTAFAGAAAVGPEVVLELDVWACRADDGTIGGGELVVMHDETVVRTTDANLHALSFAETAGLGGAANVMYYKLKQLKELDAGYRFTPDGGATFPFRGQGIKVPTLEEVISALTPTRSSWSRSSRLRSESCAKRDRTDAASRI